ncbi:IS3 family transposase [Paraburkholderia tuberum]|uniref:IS3 family transposase n=1 Tax=Paraburkholderia tuberum TaxID=157910 RepID=UPI003D28DBD3
MQDGAQALFAAAIRCRLGDRAPLFELGKINVQQRALQGRCGYRRITATIRQSGQIVNHKAVQRLMRHLRQRLCGRLPDCKRFYHIGW